MEAVTRHSAERAIEEAIVLWSLGSTQWPISHQAILDAAASQMIETVSSFALNARRALEVLPQLRSSLAQSRWNWKPTDGGEVVGDLRDALNRIIHAKKLLVGFERIPDTLSVIDGGALVIPYVKAETDRRELAYVDPFAMAHAFLYEALPALGQLVSGVPAGKVH